MPLCQSVTDLENDDHWQNISKGCFIKTPQNSNCTLDVSEVFPSSCNQNEYLNESHYLQLVCDNTQYRPIITNELNISCNTYYGYLNIKKCSLLWQDLDAYGKLLSLLELYLEDCEDQWDKEIVETDYWKKYRDSRGETKIGFTDSQREPVVIPYGLRWVESLTIINMDHTPGILLEFTWPWMNQLVLTNIQLPSHFLNSCLQTIFPRLQRLQVECCNLTQMPFHFRSDDKTSELPGNLTETENPPSLCID